MWALLAGLIGAASASPARQQPTPTPSAVTAIVAVERATVFPTPDRRAEPLTYLYERERVPVLAQTMDGVFLLVPVEDTRGWILRAQVDIEGDLALVPLATTPTAPPTPFLVASPPATSPTRAPLPTQTTPPDATSEVSAGETATPGAAAGGEGLPPVMPGEPPPLTITLPEGWQGIDMVVPFRTFDGASHDVPLTIYYGPLPGDVKGYIYLYWGFPNTVDWVTREYNLWADGVQLLRGSLIGESCNLGVYEQRAFMVGGLEGVGTYYQAANCADEADTSGWFATVRVYDGTFAFFTAVEPWDARTAQRENLQAILDSVEFLPPEGE